MMRIALIVVGIFAVAALFAFVELVHGVSVQ